MSKCKCGALLYEGESHCGACNFDGKNTPDIVEETIKKVTSKFLGWKLPEDFDPDGGISYDPDVCETIGTHLFTAQQAESMFRYLLKDELENIHQQGFKDGEKKGREESIQILEDKRIPLAVAVDFDDARRIEKFNEDLDIFVKALKDK